MWSLGKVINTPEVARVFIGSFWDQPLQKDENRKLFEYEANDLFADIQTLPRNAALRKLNDFIKRARLAKVRSTCCLFLLYSICILVNLLAVLNHGNLIKFWKPFEFQSMQVYFKYLGK